MGVLCQRLDHTASAVTLCAPLFQEFRFSGTGRGFKKKISEPDEKPNEVCAAPKEEVEGLIKVESSKKEK
jgi:hypothetical protein